MGINCPAGCSYALTDQKLQDEIEYWKSRAARLTLLTEQMMGNECKMTVVTLRYGGDDLVRSPKWVGEEGT